MMTQTMTGQRWADKWEVEFDWSANGFHTTDGWEHHAYALKMVNAAGGEIEIPWKQGLGVDSTPSPDGTLWAIATDVLAGDMDWEEFCHQFGYDSDSLSSYWTWEACQLLGTQIREFCVSAEMFEEFCGIEEGV